MLEVLLLHRLEDRARQDYALHLMWLTGLQLFSLGGGRDYPVPSPTALFPHHRKDADTAEDIRERILRRLQVERSEP